MHSAVRYPDKVGLAGPLPLNPPLHRWKCSGVGLSRWQSRSANGQGGWSRRWWRSVRPSGSLVRRHRTPSDNPLFRARRR